MCCHVSYSVSYQCVSYQITLSYSSIYIAACTVLFLVYCIVSCCGVFNSIIWYHMSHCIVLHFIVHVFYIFRERNQCEQADRARWRPHCCSLPVHRTSCCCSTRKARSAGPQPLGFSPPRCLTSPLKGNRGRLRCSNVTFISGKHSSL